LALVEPSHPDPATERLVTYLLVYAPAPVWGLAVGVVAALRSGLLRGLGLAILTAAAGFGGGLVGLLAVVLIKYGGTGT